MSLRNLDFGKCEDMDEFCRKRASRTSCTDGADGMFLRLTQRMSLTEKNSKALDYVDMADVTDAAESPCYPDTPLTPLTPDTPSSICSDAKTPEENLGFAIETTQLPDNSYVHRVKPSNEQSHIGLPEGLQENDQILMVGREHTGPPPKVDVTCPPHNPSLHSLKRELSVSLDSGIDTAAVTITSKMNHTEIMIVFSTYTEGLEITRGREQIYAYYYMQFEIRPDFEEGVISAATLCHVGLPQVGHYQLIPHPQLVIHKTQFTKYQAHRPPGNTTRYISTSPNSQDIVWDMLKWTLFDPTSSDQPIKFARGFRIPYTNTVLSIHGHGGQNKLERTELDLQKLSPTLNMLFSEKAHGNSPLDVTFNNLQYLGVFLCIKEHQFVAEEGQNHPGQEPDKELWITYMDAAVDR